MRGRAGDSPADTNIYRPRDLWAYGWRCGDYHLSRQRGTVVACIDEVGVDEIRESGRFGEVTKIFGGAHESVVDENIAFSVIVVFK